MENLNNENTTIEMLRELITTHSRKNRKTSQIQAELKAAGYQVTAVRINRALGRLVRKVDHTGKVENLTENKRALLSAVREVVPFPYDDQFLLNIIGESWTVQGAWKKVADLAVHA